MKSILIRALSLFLIIISISAATAVEIREERVQFKPGETGATIKGRIKGRQIVDYRLSVKAGQSMAVILETSNSSNYFNISAPGTNRADL
jgi:nitrous oxidase accessory protein NosD